jgi:hypothetical protein
VLGEVLKSGGEVYGLSPLVIAFGPSVLVLGVAAISFARLR